MPERTPEIVKAADKFKRELLRGNDKALRELTQLYIAAWRRLKEQLDAVTALIREAEAAGMKPVLRPPGSFLPLKENEYSINWLYRQQRYQQLMYQLELELVQTTNRASAMVGLQQEFGLTKGGEDAVKLLDVTLGPAPEGVALRMDWIRVNRAAVHNIVGFLADGSPLDYKFADMALETVQGIRGVFVTGLAEGWNPRKIAREIKREYAGALANALTTCRTETLRAYRTAAHETYKANDDVVKGWIWSCAHQARTCAACWGMDGTFHTLDEVLTDHPNGRCVARPVTKTWDEILGRKTKAKETGTSAKGWDPEEAFRKLSEEDQRRVLGAKKYEAWQAGELSLRDIPVKATNRVWGDHYRIKTLGELGLVETE